VSSSTSSFKTFTVAFVVLFSLSILGFVAGSELLIRFLVAPGNSYDAVKHAFHSGRDTAVVFGDSRAVSGFVPGSGYANFASKGENLETTLGKLNAYIASGRRGNVLLQLDPQHFSFYRQRLAQAELLEDFLNPDSRGLQMLRPHFRRYLFEYWAAIWRDPARLFADPEEIVSDDPNPIVKLSDMPADAQRRQAMIRTQLHIPVPGYADTADMMRLRETLTRARNAGVAICIVTFPVGSAYREAADHYPVFADIRAEYGALAADAGLIYVNLWDEYEDDNFDNVDHLNSIGARRLNTDLRNACKAP
jgi:hypothetical protein